ncbi:helix-turn-helix domain-containing protein [Roseibium sp.]
MHWDDLRILLAINRSRSLSAAARMLGINQSTVSRRILGCETE